MAAPGELPSARKFLFPGVFVLLLFGLLILRQPPSSHSPRPQTARSLSGRAFGTNFTIRWLGELSEDQVEHAVRRVVEQVNASMSTYHPESELSRFNRAEVVSATVSAALAQVLAEAAQIHSDTGGAFDPTVGPVVDAWGFGPAEVVEPPSAGKLARAQAAVGFDKLEFDGEGRILTKRHPELRVDLSAIAKGYAVDEVAEALRALGSAHHLVEIGGEIRSIGKGPRGPWTVGIERPERSPQKTVFEVLKLGEGGFATSGNYRNFVLAADGRKVTHIIDPRTGGPVDHGLGSVSVVDPRCARADALATALYVLGPKDGLQWAESKEVPALFLTVQNGEVVRRATSAYGRLVAQETAP